MRLVYQVPLVTTLVLILTIVVNVGGLMFFTEHGFQGYLKELEEENSASTDPALLEAFSKMDKLDPAKQKEYEDIIRELSTVSTALENISKNPDLYTNNGTGKGIQVSSGRSITGLPPVVSPSSYFVRALTNPISITSDTPEGRFAIYILRNILLLNLIWLILVIISFSIWIRRIFLPVNLVTENIRRIINLGEYSSTLYSRKDEFTPLVDTINSLQKTLAIQEKIRSNFLSDISHEIRTPITALQCYLEAIEDGVMKLDDKMSKLLSRELSRLTDITGQIMAYESLTHNTFDNIRVEKFAPADIIDGLIEEYQPQLLKSEQSIKNILTPRLTISMDISMFHQILHNIFSNFIKYAGKSTILNINIERTTHAYILIFSDNGIGVAQEELPFVKEKFYRVDKGRNQQESIGSMGIGLSIVDTIARLHNGTCIIERGDRGGFVVKIRIKR